MHQRCDRVAGPRSAQVVDGHVIAHPVKVSSAGVAQHQIRCDAAIREAVCQVEHHAFRPAATQVRYEQSKMYRCPHQLFLITYDRYVQAKPVTHALQPGSCAACPRACCLGTHLRTPWRAYCPVSSTSQRSRCTPDCLRPVSTASTVSCSLESPSPTHCSSSGCASGYCGSCPRVRLPLPCCSPFATLGSLSRCCCHCS